MTKWIRFNFKQDTSLFGTLDGDSVDEYEGDLFENPKPTGRKKYEAQIGIFQSTSIMNVPTDILSSASRKVW